MLFSKLVKVTDKCWCVCVCVCRWNQLDLIIVLLSIMGITLEEIQGNASNASNASMPINPTIIRIMRVLRITRGVVSALSFCLSVLCYTRPCSSSLNAPILLWILVKQPHLWDFPICHFCMIDPSRARAE